MNNKNGLTTDSRKKPKINKYVEDGYTVSEIFFPDSNTYMVTKEKGNKVFYYYQSSSVCTRGVYDKAEFEKRMADFNQQMDEWNTKCDEWNKEMSECFKRSFGAGFTNFPDFPDFPDFPQYSNPFSGVSQTVITSSGFDDNFDNLFDSALLEDSTKKKNHSSTSRTTRQKKSYQNGKQVHYSKETSSSGSCLGCLIWTILILCLFCIILYGMGVIGGNIIHFITDFFKSLF